MAAVIAICALVVTADYLLQCSPWCQRQKMSMREIKNEYRQSEGNPMVKARSSSSARLARGNA